MSTRPPSAAEDIGRLKLLIREAERAVDFASGQDRNALDDDLTLRYALIKAIENVGHEAGLISPETKAAEPGIPWENMAGMRHRLAHAYDGVDLDIVWATATEAIPEALVALKRLLDILEELTTPSPDPKKST